MSVTGPYPSPAQEKHIRDPEWEPIAPGVGQTPTTRTFEWDPIFDQVRSSGPTVLIEPPERPE